MSTEFVKPAGVTSASVRLVKDHILEAAIDIGKNVVASSVDLDFYITNDDGSLKWGGNGWSRTSKNPRLEGATLKATCEKTDGSESVPSSIKLSEHIKIDADGKLVYF